MCVCDIPLNLAPLYEDGTAIRRKHAPGAECTWPVCKLLLNQVHLGRVPVVHELIIARDVRVCVCALERAPPLYVPFTVAAVWRFRYGIPERLSISYRAARRATVRLIS